MRERHLNGLSVTHRLPKSLLLLKLVLLLFQLRSMLLKKKKEEERRKHVVRIPRRRKNPIRPISPNLEFRVLHDIHHGREHASGELLGILPLSLGIISLRWHNLKVTICQKRKKAKAKGQQNSGEEKKKKKKEKKKKKREKASPLNFLGIFDKLPAEG